MTYEEALEYIRQCDNFAQKKGLGRVAKVLNSLSNPQNNYDVVHLVGTNGKGSTTSMTANILQKSGLKVGKFISPYVYKFGERISVDGVEITPEKIVFYANEIIKTLKNLDNMSLSEFEFITVIAFLYYNDANCDIVCLEAGLGGEFDATNVVKSPKVSVVTKISLDHTRILGDNLTDIATTKCKIIKNSVCVSYPKQDEEVIAVLNKYNVIFPKIDELSIKKCDIYGSEITYKGKNYKISLMGEHQIYNALMVIEICMQMGNISYEDVYYGLSNTKFSGRMEIISENPLVIYDGAHNMDGILALEKSIKNILKDRKITLIMGMVQEKNASKCVEIITKHCENAYFVRLNNPRSENPLEISKFSKCKSDVIEDAKTAFNIAKKEKSDVILICGSLFLAENLKET